MAIFIEGRLGTNTQGELVGGHTIVFALKRGTHARLWFPLDASGNSGTLTQKAAAHGVHRCSVCDNWCEPVWRPGEPVCFHCAGPTAEQIIAAVLLDEAQGQPNLISPECAERIAAKIVDALRRAAGRVAA